MKNDKLNEHCVHKKRTVVCIAAALICACFGIASLCLGLLSLLTFFMDPMMGKATEWISIVVPTGEVIEGIIFFLAAQAWWKCRTERALVLTALACLLAFFVARGYAALLAT